MTDAEKLLIKEFFSSTSRLLEAGVIRSAKIMGDIGEWLCVKNYGLVLAKSGRNPGFDGYIGDKKVQVKLHNSPKGTNSSAGNPEKYDLLYVIIGPDSSLRMADGTTAFHAYKFTSDEVQELMKRESGHYFATEILHARAHDAIPYE